MSYSETIGERKALGIFYKAEDNNFDSGLFEFKGTLYKTHNLHFTGSLPINHDELITLIDQIKINHSEEEEVFEKLNVKKFDELIEELNNIDNEDAKNDIISNELKISKYNKVEVRFSDDLCLFWDPQSKKMYYSTQIHYNDKYKVVSGENGKLLLQTPIWVLSNKEKKDTLTKVAMNLMSLYPKEGFDLVKSKQFPKCPECKEGRLSKLRPFDAARTLYSMKFLCDNCSYTQNLPYLSNWKLSWASDKLTAPFIIGTYNKNYLELKKIDLLKHLENCRNINVKYFEKLEYCQKLKIKNVLLGFWQGYQIRKFHTVHNVGQELNTAGIHIVLKEEYYEDALVFMRKIYENSTNKIKKKLEEITSDNLSFRKFILHSLSHAFIMKLCIYSGLDVNNFDYLYDIPKNRIIIFEIAPGGIGACKVLSETDEETKEAIIIDFIESIKNSIQDCNCDDRCKYCLAFVGCGEYNNYLNRFSLGPLFNLKADDMSWGF